MTIFVGERFVGFEVIFIRAFLACVLDVGLASFGFLGLGWLVGIDVIDVFCCVISGSFEGNELMGWYKSLD